MGAFVKWLLHEDQKELFEHLYAAVFNLVFLGVSALLFWFLGRLDFAFRLLKGYWVFWILLPATATLLVMFRRVFRLDLDSHPDAYIISAIATSGVLVAGWSAFAALSVKQYAVGSPMRLTVALYITGLFSSYASFGLVSTYYNGSLYRAINLPLAGGTFALFSIWPTAARATYGWFFDLF
jgi:hypothetical protein